MSVRALSTLANGFIVLASVWLFVSPWLLGYGGDAGWNSTIVAAVVAALATVRLAVARVPAAGRLDWLTVLLGAWLILAPAVLDGYGKDAAIWNSVVLGILIAFLAVLSGLAARDARESAV
jgi:hypothetical protein